MHDAAWFVAGVIVGAIVTASCFIFAFVCDWSDDDEH